MPSPVVVIRHVPHEGLGYLEGALRRAGARYDICEIGQIAPEVVRAATALIVMGGPMSANDPEPWVDAELRAIEAALESSRPVLGVCLGAQLLAKALGAR